MFPWLMGLGFFGTAMLAVYVGNDMAFWACLIMSQIWWSKD